MRKKRVVAWGKGKIFNDFLVDYNKEEVEIVGIVDSNPNKCMGGKKII